MTTLSRNSFLREMRNKNLNVAVAQQDPRLAGIDFTQIDPDGSGYIGGQHEMALLFAAIDSFDANGSAHSVDLGAPDNPTRAGKIITALRQLVRDNPANHSGYIDPALSVTLPNGLRGEIKRGDKGRVVTALQYALGRLDHLRDRCDGKFGPITEQSVMSFQDSRSLSPTGVVTSPLLGSIDSSVSALDLRTPAQMASDPMVYLSGFRRLRLPEIHLHSTAEVFTWDSPEIQRAYGKFVADYWEVMKQNRIEGDCKNIALFMMDQFRKQLKEDRFVSLPHPVLGNNEGDREWIVATSDKTRGLFSRADQLLRRDNIRVRRPGYDAVLKVQTLDARHSMIYGVNVHFPRLSTHQVARATKRLFDWNPAYSNRGDASKPEVPVNQLQPGHLIFIDHTGDRRYDHTVTVIKVERDQANRTRKLVLAVGAYDDVRDNSAATSVEGVGFAIVNTYSEEVTVTLDESGRIENSEVTYTSEPEYMVDPRYSARTTLMEQRHGGTLFVGRWGNV
ncbi:MAG: peptidoglycan-binding domain-containing protein [Thiolinea sp.]